MAGGHHANTDVDDSHADPEADFFSWLYDVTHSDTTAMLLAIFVCTVMAITAEATTALYRRVRQRPVCWLRSRILTLIFHNILATTLHGIYVSLMFCLMLVFMTLNFWMCFSVVMGAIIGHLVFHWSFTWPSERPESTDEPRPNKW